MVEEKLKKLQELYDEGVKEEGTEKQQTEDVLKYIFIFTNSRSSPSPKSKDPRPLIYSVLILRNLKCTMQYNVHGSDTSPECP